MSLCFIVKLYKKYMLWNSSSERDEIHLWVIYSEFIFVIVLSFYLCRDYFYQFGEIRSIIIASSKNCGFICYTTRQAAEFAAERSFNKAIIKGKRLKVLWGKSQEERTGAKDKTDKTEDYAPVPGLPGGRFTYECYDNAIFHYKIMQSSWLRHFTRFSCKWFVIKYLVWK